MRIRVLNISSGSMGVTSLVLFLLARWIDSFAVDVMWMNRRRAFLLIKVLFFFGGFMKNHDAGVV